MPRTRRLAALGAAAVILTVGAAPFLANAADHLDAPSLGSLSTGSLQGDRDINDLYVFDGVNASKTVLAMTVSPAAGVLGPKAFGSRVRYTFHVDNSGDNVADINYVARFGARGSGPGSTQTVSLFRNGVEIAKGSTGHTTPIRTGGKLFAGIRSDPFFFDLLGFRGTLGLGPNTNTLCDSDPTDFFKDLNAMAIVIEVPDAALGRHIGVWVTTSGSLAIRWADPRSTPSSTTRRPTRRSSTGRLRASRPRSTAASSARTSAPRCARCPRATRRVRTPRLRPMPSRRC
jgi:hypothetical protein